MLQVERATIFKATVTVAFACVVGTSPALAETVAYGSAERAADESGHALSNNVIEDAGSPLTTGAADSVVFPDHEPPAGFVEKDGAWYYYREGKRMTGEVEVDGARYWFDRSTGAMARAEWVETEDDGGGSVRRCYFDGNGRMVHGAVTLPCWDGSGTANYYLDESDGGLVSGWILLHGGAYGDGSWVYYDESSYRMLTGEQYLPLRFETNGAMAWHVLDASTGALTGGWIEDDEGHRVRFDGSGLSGDGWTTVEGVRTLIDGMTGETLISCDDNLIMCQAYGPWAEGACGPSTIRVSGCGAGAVAHAVSLITTDADKTTPLTSGLSRWASDDVTPGDIVDAMERMYPGGGYYLAGDGIKESAMRKVCESEYGLLCESIDRNQGDESVEEIARALGQGRCVIASSIGRSGDVFSAGEIGEYWSSGGHYICFYKYEDGVFWAKDSGTPSGKGNACKYDWNMMRRFLAASPSGSCFWVGKK